MKRTASVQRSLDDARRQPGLAREHNSTNLSLTAKWKSNALKATALNTDLLKRFGQFACIGGSGVLVDMVVFFCLADPRTLHMSLVLSKALAAETAICTNFLGNEFWTFRDMRSTGPSWPERATRFSKFNLICLAGIALSVLLLKLQMHYFHLNVYLSNLIAIAIVSLWNFGLNL